MWIPFSQQKFKATHEHYLLVINEMRRRFSYLTPQEAFDTITKTMTFRRLDSESISIGDAYGRILAQDIVA